MSIDKTGIDVVKKYIKEMKITFPNLHDPTTKSAAEYGVRGVPMTFFIDVHGKAVGVVMGPRQWDGKDVQNLVEHLLAEANS